MKIWRRENDYERRNINAVHELHFGRNWGAGFLGQRDRAGNQGDAGTEKVQTNVVALITSLILTPAAVIVLCTYYQIVIEWYYIFASFIAAFIVYLVSTGGWERVTEMWNRNTYKKK